jgi:uncharacterized membrane protein
MNESALMIVLRLLHIISGVFWVGTVFIIAWFLLPSNKSTGQAGLTVMRDVMVKRKLSIYLMIAMGLTILSGLTMYAHMMMVSHGVWASSMMAKVLGVGALCAIVAGALGGSISKRTGMQMAAIGKAIDESGQPPTSAQLREIDALQAKSQKVMAFVAILLVVALAAMASARYM